MGTRKSWKDAYPGKEYFGTKTAAKEWLEEFTEAIVSLGFTPSLAGNCVFMH